VLVLVVGAGVLGLVGAPGAWAHGGTAHRATSQQGTVEAATGTISCAVGGEVTFSPGLTNTPVTPVTMAVTLDLNRCTAKATDHASPYGLATTKETLVGADCTTVFVLAPPIPIAATVTWGPAAIADTSVDFPGFQASTQGSTMDAGFLLPGTTGAASATGSYTGSDGGATSHVSAWTTKTLSQLTAGCARTTGLTKLHVRGKISLG
jgi:hypothetical protein